MLTNEQLRHFKARIEMELSALADWVEAPEIRGAAHEKILRRQADLEAAFIRLQKNAFGLCTLCGRPLSETQLESDPSTAICTDCDYKAELLRLP